MKDDRRELLVWLMERGYLCQVFTEGNETATVYLDVDEVLEEYEEQIKGAERMTKEFAMTNPKGLILAEIREEAYKQGIEYQRNKDINELQHILLNNINDYKQAFAEIIAWTRKQIEESIEQMKGEE